MKQVNQKSFQRNTASSPPPPQEAGEIILWDVFQALQDLTDDEDQVLLTMEYMLSRGLVRWAAGGDENELVTLH